jgi:hypothetical protein
MPKALNVVYGTGKPVYATYGGIQCLPFRNAGTFYTPKQVLFFYRAPCTTKCIPFWELNPEIVPIKPSTPPAVTHLGKFYPLLIQGGEAGVWEEGDGNCQFG